jgi:hypothetical protein
MFRSVSRLAIFAAAVSVSATQAQGEAPCAPPLGETAAQVVSRCGKPDEVFSTMTAIGWVQSEWRYGEVYVGLIDGTVAYVIK